MKKSKIFLLSFAHMCSDISNAALPAFLPFLVLAFGYGYAQAAFILFGFSFISSLVQPALGYMADKKPAFWHLPLGILLSGAGVGVLGLMPCYGLIVAAAIVSGIGSALFHPVGASYTTALSGDRKGTGMSIFSAGGNIGYALGPVLAGALLAAFGLGASAVFGVMGLVAALLVLRALAREPVPGSKKRATDEPEKGNDWRAFGWLTGVILSRSGIHYAVNAFVALYWMRYFGADASEGAFMLAVYGAAGIASNLAGGWLSDRIGYVRILRMNQALLIPAIIAFASTQSAWVAAAVLVVLAFALYASYSPVVVLGQAYLAKNPGFSAGVTLGLSRSAGGLSMPIVGLIADAWGLKGAFCCLLVLAGIGLVCSMRLKQNVRQN